MSKKLHIVGPDDNNPARHALRVLVADDDRDSALLLGVVLRDEGHEVHTVLRGDEVLELVRLVRPDAVILDINMPGMSGYAVAREITQRHGNLRPLLIAVSGVWTKPSEQLVGSAVGFDHYLVKPYDVKQLLQLLEPLTRRSAGGQASGG